MIVGGRASLAFDRTAAFPQNLGSSTEDNDNLFSFAVKATVSDAAINEPRVATAPPTAKPQQGNRHENVAAVLPPSGLEEFTAAICRALAAVCATRGTLHIFSRSPGTSFLMVHLRHISFVDYLPSREDPSPSEWCQDAFSAGG